MGPTDTGQIVLRGIEVFAGLPDEVLATVRSFMDVRKVNAGTVLFSEGDSGDGVYIVRHGTVQIVKEQDGTLSTLARRGRGDIIGEMALIDASPRFATAVCESDCELYVLSRGRFFDVLAAHPDIAERILRVMTARVREADLGRMRQLEEKAHDLELARQRLEATLTYRDRVLAVSPYPIIVTDTTDRLHLVNAAASHLFGHTSQSRLWDWIVPHDPDVPQRAADQLALGLTWQTEIEAQGPSGQLLLCKVTAVPIADTGDGQSARLWIFEDETEIRALQEQAIVRERLITKGEMAGEIAHELNNYLAILSGNVELLPMYLGENRPEGVDRTLVNIQLALTQIGVFTDGMLRSRHPSGQRTSIDLNEFLRNQIVFLKPQKRFKKIIIKSEWDESVPPLECDPSGLQQVLYNLLLNAADALTVDGSERHTARVSTRFLPEAQSIQMIVADDGPGIPPGLADRMFRERVSSKPTGHGFGLLTIARIIQEHRGTITAGSGPSGGAEFVVTLPLTPATP